MNDSPVHSTLSVRQRSRLVRQLRAAHDSLAGWNVSLREIADDSMGARPKDTDTLLALIADAQRSVDTLLEKMGNTIDDGASASPFPRGTRTARKNPSSPAGICVRAARACGRALGSAFREAQFAADAASARLLYGSVRDFEKQIWMLDPHQAE